MIKDEVMYRFAKGKGWLPYDAKSEHSTVITNARGVKYRVSLSQIFEAPPVGSLVWELTLMNGYRSNKGKGDEPDYPALIGWMEDRQYAPEEWPEHDKWQEHKTYKPEHVYVLVEYTKL